VKTSTLRRKPEEYLDPRSCRSGELDAPKQRFNPQRLNVAASEPMPIAPRMYTEEEVAGMLQVSMSQLRKWRMKRHLGKQQGPPFRKLGRLVRYPEKALQAYINGD
jgi:hypothetical protein